MWQQPKYPAGTPVKVKVVESEEFVDGELLTEYDLNSDNNEIPKIKVGPKFYFGYEVWWIPTAEVTMEPTDNPGKSQSQS